MSIVQIDPSAAGTLVEKYRSVSGDVQTSVAALSPLITEALALLEQPGQNPMYGPMPALTTVSNELATDGRDLDWRVDWIVSSDALPMGTTGKLQFNPDGTPVDSDVSLVDALQATGLTEEQAASAKQAIIEGADFTDAVDAEKRKEWNDNMAAFRRMEAESWTEEQSPFDDAQYSLNEIRDILDTARQDKDKGDGIGAGGEIDNVWSTNDLKAIIENKHGYYTDAQIAHAEKVLAMAESSSDARTALGITESGGGWSWGDIGHLTLDVFGMVPVVGNAADGINAAWYAAEGKWLDAALSSVALIPGIGQAATLAKGAIKSAASGIVFKSLDDALQWVKRWLEQAGILKRGTDVPGTPGGNIPGFAHNRSAGAAHILDPVMSKAPNPGSARYRAIMRKKRGIANVSGNGGVTGKLNPAEADLLAESWLGPNFTTTMTKKGPMYQSADGLRQYRPPSAKPNAGKYSSTGYQANFETRSVPSGTWDNNAHIDIDPFG